MNSTAFSTLPTKKWDIIVAIPACNEEENIMDCLKSIQLTYINALPLISRADIILAAHNCTDKTVTIAKDFLSFLPLKIIEIKGEHTVGAVRNFAINSRVNFLPESSLQRTWIFNTDSDSKVPLNWIPSHLKYAQQDYDLLSGLVTLKKDKYYTKNLASLFSQVYQEEITSKDHRHFHGANMGVKANVFKKLSGFKNIAHGEDQDLITKTIKMGLKVHAYKESPVETSARRKGRCKLGMANYIYHLLRRHYEIH